MQNLQFYIFYFFLIQSYSIYHCRKYHHFKTILLLLNFCLFPPYLLFSSSWIYLFLNLCPVLRVSLEYMFRWKGLCQNTWVFFYDLLYYQMVFQKDCTNLKSSSKDSLDTHTPRPIEYHHFLSLTWPTGETKALSHCWFNLHACMHAQLFSLVWLFATLWTVARQAPLSLGFSRPEYWDGLPLPST